MFNVTVGGSEEVLETNRKHSVMSLLISLNAACTWLSINYNSILYTRNSVHSIINQEFGDQNVAIKRTPPSPKQTPLHLPVPLYLNMVVHITYMVIKLCTNCTGSEDQCVTISVMSNPLTA